MYMLDSKHLIVHFETMPKEAMKLILDKKWDFQNVGERYFMVRGPFETGCITDKEFIQRYGESGKQNIPRLG